MHVEEIVRYFAMEIGRELLDGKSGRTRLPIDIYTHEQEEA